MLKKRTGEDSDSLVDNDENLKGSIFFVFVDADNCQQKIGICQHYFFEESQKETQKENVDQKSTMSSLLGVDKNERFHASRTTIRLSNVSHADAAESSNELDRYCQ